MAADNFQKTALAEIMPSSEAQPTVGPPETNTGNAHAAPGAPAKAPVGESELIALVAGNAISENIIQEINSRGLAFRPSDQYRSLLQTAGADENVMAALANAKVAGNANDGARDQLLQHLANAS